MEIPNNPTSGIHYEPIEGGTTANPVITDLTYGAEAEFFTQQKMESFLSTDNIMYRKSVPVYNVYTVQGIKNVQLNEWSGQKAQI